MLRNDLSQAKGNSESYSTRGIELEMEVGSLKARLLDLSKDNGQAQDRIKELRRKNESAQDTISNLSREIEELKQIGTERDNLLITNEISERQLEEFNHKLSDTQELSASYFKQIQDLESTLEN